jgi:Hypothetical glycosyl hydrolase family 15
MRPLAGLIVTAALALGGAPASSRAEDTVGHVRIAIDSAAVFSSYETTAERYGVVILHSWQQDRLRALKQANPDLEVLVYKNLSFATAAEEPPGHSSSGVPLAEAHENPDWFLRDAAGFHFTSRSYGWLWAMDVGSASYQRRWADNVVAELESEGWDGVFIDDANPTMKYHFDVAGVAKYPSDETYGAATASALAHIGARVRKAGKLAVANIGAWSEYPAVASGYLDSLDGAMDEQFLKWGTEPDIGYVPERWGIELEAIKEAERRDKIFLGVTHSDAGDTAAALYGYATMLLGSDGAGHFALAEDYAHETCFREYDYDLGPPTGPETADDDGVHRRPFERGLVLVNPTTEVREVSLGGTYTGSGLIADSHATMPPTSGLVLEDAPRASAPWLPLLGGLGLAILPPWTRCA